MCYKNLLNSSPLNKSELLSKVRTIEIRARGLTNDIFSGEYHSAFKGKGMSFSEVREYSYGDDVKLIDWNVTARLRTPYIKVFEEERELTVMLLVDVSGSAFFGTQEQLKSERMTEMCAVLAFSAITNNDKVGVLFFSDTVEQFIPPKKGKSHVLRIIYELLEYGYGLKGHANQPASEGKPPQPTRLDVALRYFSNVIKKPCIAFILSDFIATDYEKALLLAAKRHDVIGLRVYDVHDAQLPKVGLLHAYDPETGRQQWIDTNDAQARKTYQAHHQAYVDRCRTTFAQSGAALMNVATNQAYIPLLVNFFRTRSLVR